MVPSVDPETIAYYFGLQFKIKLIGYFVSVTLPGFLWVGGVEEVKGDFPRLVTQHPRTAPEFPEHLLRS